jgi:hypothetical protein
MYSSVAAHQNYSNRQQQDQQQDQQDDESTRQDDGAATRRHSDRHHRRHRSITTRLLNYIKEQFQPEREAGKEVCCGLQLWPLG